MKISAPLLPLVIIISFTAKTQSFALVKGVFSTRYSSQSLGATVAASTRGHFLPKRRINSSFKRRFYISMSSSNAADGAPKYQFVDIGANLLDERFRKGEYHGKVRHEPDWDQVMERAVNSGVSHIILTAGTFRESRRAIALVRKLRETPVASSIQFGCTVGVHPTRCTQEFVKNVKKSGGNNNGGNENDSLLEGFDILPITSAGDVLEQLAKLIQDGQRDGTVVSIGEIGLDYDRLQFSAKEDQQEFFRRQLRSFASSAEDLPLFLHNRNVGLDLLNILDEEGDKSMPPGKSWTGVVHSFDDSLELAHKFMDRGLYIGLNGCSLKTEQNLEVVKEIPLDRILLETDCPYCEVKATHAGHKYIKTTFSKKPEKKFQMGLMVKGRNEPNQMIRVAEIIAGVKGVPVKDVVDQCYKNSQVLYHRWMSTPAKV